METSNLSVTVYAPHSIPYYSDKDIAYLTLDDRYLSFYKYEPNFDSFAKAIIEKNKSTVNRELVVRALRDDYKSRSLSHLQEQNLVSLSKDNSYTIVTAHQPSLFTGPLYFVFKICSAIKLTRQLKEHYPQNNFIPVFISGGEDHDFDEINHARIFGKNVSWENGSGGSVGKIELDSDFDLVIESFTETLGDRNFGNEIKELLLKSRKYSQFYSDFNFHLVNNLFEKYGLLVLNMDNKALKQAFLPVLEKELINRPSQALVKETQEKLDALGFKSQAYPREINLFYLTKGRRDRIEYNSGNYEVLGTDLRFNEEEIIKELHDHPEKFSPNVVMRPLYQEYILPNLAYIGGGGEIAYWLERKRQFEHFGISFPVLVRRDSAILMNSATNKQLEKLGLTLSDFFKDENSIINDFLANHTEVEISLDDQKEEYNKVIQAIIKKSDEIDPTISKWILSEEAKHLKIIDQMESRLKRSIKKREEVSVNQIKKLKEKLFPENNLQERKDNFFQYYLNHGPDLIDILIETFEPLEPDFLAIEI